MLLLQGLLETTSAAVWAGLEGGAGPGQFTVVLPHSWTRAETECGDILKTAKGITRYKVRIFVCRKNNENKIFVIFLVMSDPGVEFSTLFFIDGFPHVPYPLES